MNSSFQSCVYTDRDGISTCRPGDAGEQNAVNIFKIPTDERSWVGAELTVRRR